MQDSLLVKKSAGLRATDFLRPKGTHLDFFRGGYGLPNGDLNYEVRVTNYEV